MPVQTAESEIFIVKSGDRNLARISRRGGRIEELFLRGIKVLGTYQRTDGKPASTHLAAPFLGPSPSNFPEFRQIKQHGDLRNNLLRLVRETGNSLQLTYPVKDPGYPEGLTIDEMFSVEEESFTAETLSQNGTGKKITTNLAWHNYWDSPEGWEGVTLNGKNVADEIRKDTAVPLKDRNVIVIPGKPVFYLIQKGFRFAQLWTGRNEDATKFDQHYFCLEPVEFDPEHFQPTPGHLSFIKPEYKRRTSVTISLKDAA